MKRKLNIRNNSPKKLSTKDSKTGMGQIDETWTEVNLSGFIKDNPTLLTTLRKKYSI